MGFAEGETEARGGWDPAEVSGEHRGVCGSVVFCSYKGSAHFLGVSVMGVSTYLTAFVSLALDYRTHHLQVL